jgi:hypothetical protein
MRVVRAGREASTAPVEDGTRIAKGLPRSLFRSSREESPVKLALAWALVVSVSVHVPAAGAVANRGTERAGLAGVPGIWVSAASETLVFAPSDQDTLADPDVEVVPYPEEEYWLKPPFGDRLITDVDEWRSTEGGYGKLQIKFDYNRVDVARVGIGYQIQSHEEMYPRLGACVEYAFRDRVLYGAQVEQPLLPPGRLALGLSMVRRTDHHELQQVEDFENTLAVLFGRQDYRDYFEREGYGAYLAWRVPDFSTVSVHVRTDDFRSLTVDPQAGSFFHTNREFRENPSIDAGESRTAIVRLERLARRSRQTRAGLYHWIDLERAGHGLGGDFEYTRLLADLRSVIRLSPAATLSLRLVGGHTPEGVLPSQKHFTLGGPDGLRAHEFSKYVGNQLMLAQAEYSIGLWRISSGLLEGGLHAIVFADVGKAWDDPTHGWEIQHQSLEADGGFGLATSEDAMRIYFARNLQNADSDFVVSLRLQRPF